MIRFIFLSAISLCFLFSDCRKSQQEQENLGVIIGWNYGACATCGGFYFNPSNDTVKNPGTLYALTYTDSLTGIIERLENAYAGNLRPIFVYVGWKQLDAPANWVTVTYIKKR
ncbi:MAG TPA: hypothetical protein VK787_04525 [Puia sp.]|nr:hypothetical protein [Puia sp.]